MDCMRLVKLLRLAGMRQFDEIGSTNDWAKACLSGETPFEETQIAGTPFVVVADRQTSGRGRTNERKWRDWNGALLFSLGAKWKDFKLTRRESAVLSLRVAESVAETARETFAEYGVRPNCGSVYVKEPNDVYCDGCKLSGILIESPTPENVVVGIGVNVFNRVSDAPDELKERVASIVDALDVKPNAIDLERFREDFLARCVRKLLKDAE